MDFHVVKTEKHSETEDDRVTDVVSVECYRKGDRERGLPPLYTHMVPEGEEANAQLLALMYAQRHFQVTRVQWRGEILEPRATPDAYTEGPIEDELGIATSLISGESCIPCQISPRIISPHARPVTQETPPWMLRAVELASERSGCPAYEWVDPKATPRKSWISTSNTAGLLTTLKAMVRERLEVNVTTKDVTKALLYYLGDCGWKGERVRLAPLTYATISKMEVPWKNSSGLCLSYSHRIKHKDVIFQYSPTGNKATMREAEMLRLMSIVTRLKKEIASMGYTNQQMVDPSFFPLLITKIAEKPEVRQEGDDPTKVRVIFMVCLLELYLDKLVHSHFMNFTKTSGSNAIGTNWGRGDAAFYANKHHAAGETLHGLKPEDYFHIYGDASKLDQSIKARMLVMMSLLSGLPWDKEDPEYAFYMNLLAWSANVTSQKYVYWPDMTFRLVKGIVFSGKYSTSHLDTMSLDISFRDYINQVYDNLRLSNPDRAKRFWFMYWKKHIIWTIYGDDFMLTCPKEFQDVVSLQGLTDHLMSRWDITVKPTASFRTDSFFTKVIDDEVVEQGVIFLKRSFVWVRVRPESKPFIGLWRPTKDYFIRVAVTGTPIEDPALALGRIYQLMRDTMGTNTTAWRFLSATADALCEMFPYAPSKLAEIEEGSAKLDHLREITKKLGIMDYYDKWTIVNRPTRAEILSLFVPKHDVETIRQLRETKTNLDHISLLVGRAA